MVLLYRKGFFLSRPTISSVLRSELLITLFYGCYKTDWTNSWLCLPLYYGRSRTGITTATKPIERPQRVPWPYSSGIRGHRTLYTLPLTIFQGRSPATIRPGARAPIPPHSSSSTNAKRSSIAAIPPSSQPSPPYAVSA